MYRTSVWVAAALAALVATACTKADSSSAKLKELEDRIVKLEADQKKMGEVEKFVRPIMAQQKQQQDEQDAREPDPEARFAVDIAGNFYDGPEAAPVTIIEAFDFA